MALPPSAIALVPNAPGFTPRHVPVRARTPLGAGTTGGPVMVATPPVRPQSFRDGALEWLEDAVLVLLLVLAVPVIIILLALPVMLAFRLVTALGAAW